jgi:hypothetical protein
MDRGVWQMRAFVATHWDTATALVLLVGCIWLVAIG